MVFPAEIAPKWVAASPSQLSFQCYELGNSTIPTWLSLGKSPHLSHHEFTGPAIRNKVLRDENRSHKHFIMNSPPLSPGASSGSITLLYRQWREGHEDSLGKLVDHFRPRLLALVRSSLKNRAGRMADAEDALQSAVISFWEKAGRGDLSPDMDREDLWNILGLITVRKALKIQEREFAQKRGGDRSIAEQGVEEQPASPQGDAPEYLCAEMLELLDEDLRPFAILRLMAHTIREIADQLDCTEKKVERKLNLVKLVWQQEVSRWNS
jgi:DNA-directed RNA polymerase specialized sigma24 family protein